jgi:hypothetical protein
MIGLLIKLTWTAGATYEEVHSAMIQETARATNAEVVLRNDVTQLGDKLSAKIDSKTDMEDQKLSNLSDKINGLSDKLIDLKVQVGDIVKASTPTPPRR